MGVVFTESWQRYNRATLVGAYNDDRWTIQDEYLVKAFYGTVQPDANFTASTVAAFNPAIVQDPVVANKNRFALMGGAVGYNNAGIGMVMQKTLPKPSQHYFFGFLVRFRAGTDKANGAGSSVINHSVAIATRNSSRRLATGAGNMLYTLPADANTILTISDSNNPTTNSGPFSSYTSAGAVPPRYSAHNALGDQFKPLAYDTDFYFEIEVDVAAQKINVWCDDFLVLQPAWTTALADLVNGFEIWTVYATNTNGGTTQMSAQTGDLYLSDMYVVDATDGVEPTGRLGSATRVRGMMPASDAAVQFNRPSGFTSNADVVNDPIASRAPAAYLSGDTIGTQDTYNLPGGLTVEAAKVYAVNVRTRFANGSALAHSLAAVVENDSGGHAEISYGSTPALSGYISRSAVFNTDAAGNPWTPLAADKAKVGFKILS